jgi:hypothetical protein
VQSYEVLTIINLPTGDLRAVSVEFQTDNMPNVWQGGIDRIGERLEFH